MKIRKAKLKDLPRLAKLGVELLKYHAEFDPYFAPNKDVEKVYFKFFKRCIHSGNRRLLIAKEKDSIIGYSLGKISKRPPVFKTREMGFVNDMYVISKFRKQGVANMFLEELFAWFKSKKLRNIEIHVHTKNEIGKKAWAKYGFKEYMTELRIEI